MEAIRKQASRLREQVARQQQVLFLSIYTNTHTDFFSFLWNVIGSMVLFFSLEFGDLSLLYYNMSLQFVVCLWYLAFIGFNNAYDRCDLGFVVVIFIVFN